MTTARDARDVAVVGVEDALRRAARSLSARAGDATTARLEAEVLLAAVLDVARAGLWLRDEVSAEVARGFEALVARRAATGCPVAYLTGTRSFGRLELHVDPRVLIPRPETEELVELVEAWEADHALPEGPVADVGTGSGNVALSVCGVRAVIASDRSADALDVATANARRLGRLDRVAFVRADLLGYAAPGSLAAVVANPPYVEVDELATLADDVREFEPRDALVPAGAERVGDLYARLAREARAALRPGGRLAVEVGAGQASAVATSFAGLGFDDVAVRRDLAGIERVVAARRPADAR